MIYITPYITAHTSPYLSNKNTGLGNVLFQIAASYGISKKYNINIVFNNVTHYCNILQERFQFDYKCTILNKIYSINDSSIIFNNTIYEDSKYSRKYDDNLISSIIHIKENSILYGYFENIAYFDEYKTDILNIFSIDNHSLDVINKKYGDILNSNNTLISIHFRGNEYIINNDFDYEYYNRAINYMYKHVSNPYFLIFTDDYNRIDFNKLHIKHNYLYIENEYDYLDLWTMSLCKHNIISISTFSWWGAFLNKNDNKIVLYNKDYDSTYYDYYKVYMSI